MTIISPLKSLIPEDFDILEEEYQSFHSVVSITPHPFYVYALTLPCGQPFYIGKGKGNRAYQHMLEYCDAYKTTSIKHTIIHELIHELHEYPIVYLVAVNLTEDQAYQLEAELVDYYGRYNVDVDGILSNRIRGGNRFNISVEIAANAGQIGGSTTKEHAVGIFDPSYDRGAQTRKNFADGLMQHIDFSANGKLGGATTKERSSGIFREDLQHLRTNWAQNAANALTASGNRKGCCTKEWWQDSANREAALNRAKSRKGIPSGISVPWWTDGITNKRCLDSPGENFYHGLTRNKQKGN